MKRFLYFPCILCLLIGLLGGVLLPVDLQSGDKPQNNTPGTFTKPQGSSQPEGSASSTASAQPAPLDTADNFRLLCSACSVNRCLRRGDWAGLAAYVHPDLGVTFTPYSTVEPDTDLTFTPEQIRTLGQDETVYTWGFEDGRGNPIQMTALEYVGRYVCDKDYTQASEIGLDRIITGGNALENIGEAYPDCRFVDFCFPSADPVNDGMDWSSLKLVFRPGEERWYLVGIVHGEWTI